MKKDNPLMIEEMGRFNDFPKHCKEISQERFLSIFLGECLEEVEYKQIITGPRDEPIRTKFFSFTYNDKYAIGVGLGSRKSEPFYYMFGTDEDWNDFTQDSRRAFAGDNS